MTEWKINMSEKKTHNQHVLKQARYKCLLTDVSWLEIKRGDKFCDPTQIYRATGKPQSPEDLMPKIRFSFQPTNEKILAEIPEGHTCEISVLCSPSFGQKAKLPGLLAAISRDGVVPYFPDGDTLRAWLLGHIGCEYAVASKPNETNTRNTLVAASYIGEGERVNQPQSQAAADKQVEDIVGTLPDSLGDDDLPF